MSLRDYMRMARRVSVLEGVGESARLRDKAPQWNCVLPPQQNSQQIDSDEPTIQYEMVCKMLIEAQQGVLAVSFHKEPSREDIERRAFQIYMTRGRQPGNDIADWLAAEKELRESYWRVALYKAA